MARIMVRKYICLRNNQLYHIFLCKLYSLSLLLRCSLLLVFRMLFLCIFCYSFDLLLFFNASLLFLRQMQLFLQCFLFRYQTLEIEKRNKDMRIKKVRKYKIRIKKKLEKKSENCKIDIDREINMQRDKGLIARKMRFHRKSRGRNNNCAWCIFLANDQDLIFLYISFTRYLLYDGPTAFSSHNRYNIYQMSNAFNLFHLYLTDDGSKILI